MHIFAKYCTPSPSSVPSPTKMHTSLLVPPPSAYLTPAALDRWATDTNGAPFTEEAKEELIEFLDVTDEGNLTCVLSLVFFFIPFSKSAVV